MANQRVEENREFMLPLINVLSDEKRSQLPEHLSLTMQIPWHSRDVDSWGISATYTLLMYGIEGLNALYELATLDPLPKSGFISFASISYCAPQALLAVVLARSDVAFEKVRLVHSYLGDKVFERVKQDIRNTCENIELQREARRQLARVVHSFMSERSPLNRIENMMTFIPPPFEKRGRDGFPSAMDVLLELIAEGTLKISDTICRGLEVLVSRDLLEKPYQEYFAKYPALIDPLASSIVERQHMGRQWDSDFVIRRLDDQYIFVEIEKPRDNPCTNYPHPSGPLSHALGQVLNWFAWVEDNIAYAQSHGFPGIHSPSGVIVIGRNADLNPSQLRMLKALNDNLQPRIRIETYDDVLLNARNIIRNLTAK
jgi:hypothetical protein